MIGRRTHFSYIIIIVLVFIERNNAQSSFLRNPLNLADSSSNTDLAKSLVNSLPKPKNLPKLTDENIPASAIEEFQEGTKNEDKDLNITQLITKNGYPVETHEVVTADGYILGMFRIPGSGPAVFFFHGILCSSDDWITSGKNISLPYLMADKGYDVWMGDARGSKHSMKHVSLDPVKDKYQFWDFSWDEMGRYDLPAFIDYILDTTGQENLIYIGHSQGTTSFYVLCSERPEYNEKILCMIALATPVFMKHIFSPTLKILARFAYYKDDLLVRLVGPQLFANDLEALLKSLVCDNDSNIVTASICTTALFLIVGFNYEQANYERLPTILNHLISGSSADQAVHYAQSIKTGKFLQLDLGILENERKYGSKDPPAYNLRNVRARMAIFHGNNDWVNDIRDVRKLMRQLDNSNYTFYEVPNKSFGHLDFLFAKDVRELVYNDVIRFIEQNMSP